MKTCNLVTTTTATMKNGDLLELPCEVNYYFIETNDQLLEAIEDLKQLINDPKESVAIDVETNGLDPLLHKMILLQVGTSKNIQYVFDARKLNLQQLSFLFESACWKIGHNLKFDCKFIKHNLKVNIVKLFDTLLAEKIIRGGEYFGGEGYALDAVLFRRLGKKLLLKPKNLKDNEATEEVTEKVKKQMQCSFLTMPFDDSISAAQLAYAAQDVSEQTIFKLADWQKTELMKYGPNTLFDPKVMQVSNPTIKENYLKLFPAKLRLWETALLEFRFLEVAIDIELKGIGFSLETHSEVLTNITRDYKGYREEFLRLLAPRAKQKTLFGTAGINPDSIPQTLLSLNNLGLNLEDTNSDTLEAKLLTIKDKTSDVYKIIKSLLNYRSMSKLLQAFGEKLSNHIHPITKRIHYNIQQILDTGRISNSGPNLQQIPNKIEWKHSDDPIKDAVIKERLGLRECFQASPGYKLIIYDYSQQELRVAASVSLDQKMLRAFVEGKELHSYSATLMYDEKYEDFVKKIQKKDPDAMKKRQEAKTVSFGALYGSGAPNLAQKLHIKMEKAQEILDRYWETYASLKESMDRFGHSAHEFGYSNTVLGRRRYYSDIIQKISWIDFEQNPDVIHKKVEDLGMTWFIEDYGPVTIENIKRAKSAIIRKFKNEIKRQAGNHVIQGSSADITKLAAINIRSDLLKNQIDACIVGLVHDEVIVECEIGMTDKCKEIVSFRMKEALNSFCPNVTAEVEGKVDIYWKK